MSKINKILLIGLTIVLILIGGGIMKQKTPFKAPLKLSAQETTQGNVTIKVTPEAVAVGKKTSFQLVFETHSVDLNFDPSAVSFLVDDSGRKYLHPVWEGTPAGGHHRSGRLIFSQPLSPTASVELIIKDVAGVSQRRFRWELK